MAPAFTPEMQQAAAAHPEILLMRARLCASPAEAAAAPHAAVSVLPGLPCTLLLLGGEVLDAFEAAPVDQPVPTAASAQQLRVALRGAELRAALQRVDCAAPARA